MGSSERSDHRLRFGACVLALGGMLLTCGVGLAPAGSAESAAMTELAYRRLNVLRREMLLDRSRLAAMDLDEPAAEAVLTALRDWYAPNRRRLHRARVAVNQANFAAAAASRTPASAPADDKARAEAAAVLAEKMRTVVAARHRELTVALADAVAAKLTARQRDMWRTMRASARAGGQREWVYAPGLTSDQAKALRAALVARWRALYRPPGGAEQRERLEADYRKQTEAILSKDQLAAVESARAAATRNSRAVRLAERKVLPAPPRKKRTDPPKTAATGPVRAGLAARHPDDRGIEKDPAVVFFCDFEAADWPKRWGRTAPPRNAEAVAADGKRKFRPFAGKAMMVSVHKGTHNGISLSYPFRKLTGAEPEEIYFRYYLRLGDDWRPVRGGKLPGIGGTYGRGGWGGRRSTGINGWSARGLFLPRKNGKTPIGYYCYNADQRSEYGDHWVWETDGLGYLANNRWVCVEQHAKMNTPGENDGILRAWIDGRLAFARTDVRMRDVADLKIENIWLNVYFGGKAVAEYDNHLFIDNVVIARKYIGPMSRTPRPAIPAGP